MKKILIALGIFTLGSVLQLIWGTVYLFSDVSALTQLCVLISFLILSAVGLSAFDQLQKKTQITENLTDTFRMLVFHCDRMATVLIALGTANVVAVAISCLYPLPFWIQSCLMLGMVMVLIAAVVVVLLILRTERSKRSAEKKTSVPSECQEDDSIHNNS